MRKSPCRTFNRINPNKQLICRTKLYFEPDRNENFSAQTDKRTCLQAKLKFIIAFSQKLHPYWFGRTEFSLKGMEQQVNDYLVIIEKIRHNLSDGDGNKIVLKVSVSKSDISQNTEWNSKHNTNHFALAEREFGMRITVT